MIADTALWNAPGGPPSATQGPAFTQAYRAALAGYRDRSPGGMADMERSGRKAGHREGMDYKLVCNQCLYQSRRA